MTTSTNRNPGCLTALLRLFRGNAEPEQHPALVETFPYRVRDDFLSPAELSFYHVLSSVIAPKAVVLTKVGLSDIFFVTRPHENRSASNRIAQKHVDFLLCEPQTMRPLVGIELDDASHRRADRRERDAFVNQVFEAADLKLLHVQVQRTYNRDEIAGQVLPFLSRNATNVQDLITTTPLDHPPITSASVTQPICRKCGISMVLRTATRGDNQRQQFYGCVNYPRCREVAPA